MPYTSSGLSTKANFIAQELAVEYLSFPPEIDQSYSDLINWLGTLEGMQDFDATRNFDLDSHEWPDVGRQVSQVLPSHTMKAYQCLLHLEQETLAEEAISLLDQPNILIIDNGCGGGTASAALLALVANYQRYRFTNGLPLHPVHISCYGIDRNPKALRVYVEFIRNCAIRVRNLLIDVSDPTIFPGTLPDNSSDIAKMVSEKDRTHCVFLALSNIIRPLTQEYDQHGLMYRLIKSLGIDDLLPRGWRGYIGSKEIGALRSILDANIVDRVIMLLVGALSTRDGQHHQSWKDEMLKFQRGVRAELASLHEVRIRGVERKNLKMENPRDSFRRKRQGYRNSTDIEYDAGHVLINNSNYVADADWRKVLEPDNLRLAWARVRNALGYEMLEDSLEIRLFEVNIEERLGRLQREVLAYQWDALKVAEMLNFHVPKGLDKTPRPLSVCRLEDQILATAMIQVKSREYRKSHHPRSYAYELADGHSEHLYKGWYEQYEKFLSDARDVARNHPTYQVIETDLSSFYTNIVQPGLLDGLTQEVGLLNSRTGDLAKEIVERNCGIGKLGWGIPQGHIVSGALANIYLSPIDWVFGPRNRWGIEYFRYVDDMILIFPSDIQAEQVLELLDSELRGLQLTRSEDKTRLMTAEEFLEITAPDEILEELSKEHNFLMSDLYKVSADYVRVSSGNWWLFLERYQTLLASIGVYLSVPRLGRKIHQNLGWWRRIFNLWNRIKLPSVTDIDDLENVDWWHREFNRYNGSRQDGWVPRRERLVEKLSELFRSSLIVLDTKSSVEQARLGRRLRFAVHRLGQLGFGDNVEAVAFLLRNYPWLLRPRQVCRDFALQGYEGLLADSFERLAKRDSQEWAYIRGTILKALGSISDIDESTATLLQGAALDANTVLERTMASEAMFFNRNLEFLDPDKLLSLIEKTEDPYLSKNYALLHSGSGDIGSVLGAGLERPGMLNDALEYIRVAPSLEELYRLEPDVLREEFYGGEYSDGPEEFEVFVS